MKIGSLFTGYGGLDLAVDGELAWYSEIDKAACQVLATHHPDVPNLGDITAINWADVEPVDILTGGYPCQPFSTAGNRKGKNDERHLWPHVLTAIRAIRPRFAILENVRGHLSLGFADVLADLAQIGWAAEWGTYRASDIGAPHRRERLFIVAFDPDNNGQFASEGGRSLREGEVTWRQASSKEQRELARGSDSLVAHANIAADTNNTRSTNKSVSRQSEQYSTQQDFNVATDTDMPSGETRIGRQRRGNAGRLQLVERGGEVAADTDNGHGQAIGEMSGLRGRHASCVDMPGVSTSIVANTDSEQDGKERNPRTMDTTFSEVRRKKFGSSNFVVGSSSDASCNKIGIDFGIEESQRDSETRIFNNVADSECVRCGETCGAASAQTGGASSATCGCSRILTRVEWGQYEPAIRRWENVLGRLAPAPTIHRGERERLNPQFVEWMMGLPDGWVTGHGLTSSQELKMLGNGVVPQCAREAVAQLMQRATKELDDVSEGSL